MRNSITLTLLIHLHSFWISAKGITEIKEYPIFVIFQTIKIVTFAVLAPAPRPAYLIQLPKTPFLDLRRKK